MRTELAVEMVEAHLQKLSDRLSKGQGVNAALVARLRGAAEAGPEQLDEAIRALHARALFALVAVDSKLGRAYALGHELAEISLGPHNRLSFDRAFGARVVTVKDRLADLASSLPPHASRAVVLSLRAWEVWAAEPKLDGRWLDWPKDGAGVKVALARQGERWRDLLAGDKLGQDMLDTSHYLQAARSMIRAMVRTVIRFIRPLLPLLVLPALLLAAGIYILIKGDSKTLGLLTTVAGLVGITGAGVRARLGHVATRLQSQLWGAALDRAIGEAALVGPEEWDAKVTEVEVPASGPAPKAAANLETLRAFRRAVDSGSARRIQALLAPNAEFVHDGLREQKSGDIARWLSRLPAGSRIASQPEELESPGPSVLVSLHGDDPAEVWWIQEGKVRYWQELPTDREARAVALQLSQGHLVDLGEGAEPSATEPVPPA
jgi:uncharacterized membrane protein YvlD (DUF360 family)